MTASLLMRPATDEDRSWASRGACAQPNAPVDWWNTASTVSERVQTVVHICLEHCPVYERCHAEASALVGTELGYQCMVAGGVVYGSNGRPNRYQTKAAQSCHLCPGGAPLGGKPPRDRSECGTNAGYRRHLRERTKTCMPCRVARRTYENKWRRRKAVTQFGGVA